MFENPERWGIGLSIISALFTSSGMCIQKKSAENGMDGAKTSYHKVGVAYVTIGIILKGIILVLLPQVSMAVLAAQAVAYNTLFEYWFLGTEVNGWAWTCCAVCLLGIVVAILGSTIEPTTYNLKDILDLFFSTRSIIFTIVAVVGIYGTSEYLRRTTVEYSISLKTTYTAIVAAFIAGAFGTTSKASLEVITVQLFYNEDSNSGIFYSIFVWIMILLICALSVLLGILKMKSVSNALVEFAAWQYLPHYQSFTILFNCICGLMYFDEFLATRTSTYEPGTQHGTHLIYILGLWMVCISTGYLVYVKQQFDPVRGVPGSSSKGSHIYSSLPDVDTDLDEESSALMSTSTRYTSSSGAGISSASSWTGLPPAGGAHSAVYNSSPFADGGDIQLNSIQQGPSSKQQPAADSYQHVTKHSAPPSPKRPTTVTEALAAEGPSPQMKRTNSYESYRNAQLQHAQMYTAGKQSAARTPKSKSTSSRTPTTPTTPSSYGTAHAAKSVTEDAKFIL